MDPNRSRMRDLLLAVYSWYTFLEGSYIFSVPLHHKGYSSLPFLTDMPSCSSMSQQFSCSHVALIPSFLETVVITMCASHDAFVRSVHTHTSLYLDGFNP